MKRINVIGTSGSGKSTVARNLADVLGYPYVEMDALYWKPNWGEPTVEEFNRDIEKAVSGSTWVLDGNYSRTQPIKWAKVDTIVWVDYSWGRTVFQALKRAITRIIGKKELWPGTGNVESFRMTFLSRQSVILWTLQNYKRNKKRYAKMMSAKEYTHINFVRLTNPAETKKFIASLTAT
ncbi:adenylate kinase [Kiloniella litopenaei]|uniref:Adenylate kinase n=1 Tax=Kiloniella litopenaei TaxID=1549748 RepID=A0A0M2RA58_9PROT|nr:shikimate kinase [Kiloniella litopenaei]KKJ76493.1 adenylate kinase [Kiloniella litopenaei]